MRQKKGIQDEPKPEENTPWAYFFNEKGDILGIPIDLMNALFHFEKTDWQREDDKDTNIHLGEDATARSRKVVNSKIRVLEEDTSNSENGTEGHANVHSNATYTSHSCAIFFHFFMTSGK